MKSFEWKKVASSASLLILALSLVACQSKEAVQPPEPEAVPAPVEEEQENQEPTAPLFTAPLTGLPVEEAVTQRPLAVMINNAPAARPQSGLSSADIIIEVLAEAELPGSLRSSRVRVVQRL